MTYATTQLNGPALSQANRAFVTPADTGNDRPSFAQRLEESAEFEANKAKTGTELVDELSSVDPQPTDMALAEQNAVPTVPQLTSDFILAALASTDAQKNAQKNAQANAETQPTAPDRSAPVFAPVPPLAEGASPLLAADLAKKATNSSPFANNLAASQGTLPTLGTPLTPANENPQNTRLNLTGANQPLANPGLAPAFQDNQFTAEASGVSAPVPNLNEVRQSAAAIAMEPAKPVADTAAFALANGLADRSLAANAGAKPQPTEAVELASPQSNTANAAIQQDTSGGARNPSDRRGENAPALMDNLKPVQDARLRFAPLDNFATDTSRLSAASAPLTTPLGGAPALTVPTATSPFNQPPPQVPLNNMAVHIAAQARAGHQQFNIRLDPPELGRIDIKMEIGADGSTLTHMAVEKPETLDLLRQDSRALERALANAGLDSRNGSLSFSLKEDNQSRQQADNENEEEQPQSSPPSNEEIEASAPLREQTLNISSGLDISI